MFDKSEDKPDRDCNQLGSLDLYLDNQGSLVVTARLSPDFSQGIIGLAGSFIQIVADQTGLNVGSAANENDTSTRDNVVSLKHSLFAKNISQFRKKGRLAARRLRHVEKQFPEMPSYQRQKMVADEYDMAITIFQAHVTNHSRELSARYKRLRDFTVWKMHLHGKKVYEIAKRFSVHPSTASTWISRIKKEK